MSELTKPTVEELRARVKPSGPWFDVPAATLEADCKRCDADGLFWAKSKAGKPLLVDCAVEDGVYPSLSINGENGRGVAHFATCPEAATFGKKAKT